MSLADEKNDTIKISCTGPYVVYIDVCYKSLTKGEERTGILQLQVVGSETRVNNFTLQTADEVCRGLSSIAYLRKEEKASLHLYVKDGFKIKNATVGLSYLWGESVSFDEHQWTLPEEKDKAGLRKVPQHLCSCTAVRTDTLSRTHTNGITCVDRHFFYFVYYLDHGSCAYASLTFSYFYLVLGERKLLIFFGHGDWWWPHFETAKPTS